MQEALMQQGLDITLFGMGIVFTFLLLLVICTTVMSRVMTRFFPEAEPAAAPSPASAGQSTVGNARLRKIIEEAIKQHRNRPK
uniref:OadG family protein n=1 Tax=Microbulbifer agarilyticus TaxID=260552 RepID=UPI000492B4DF|nr:OadG family transporter subunit [Microbulbifer agarilyticus]